MNPSCGLGPSRCCDIEEDFSHCLRSMAVYSWHGQSGAGRFRDPECVDPVLTPSEQSTRESSSVRLPRLRITFSMSRDSLQDYDPRCRFCIEPKRIRRSQCESSRRSALMNLTRMSHALTFHSDCRGGSTDGDAGPWRGVMTTIYLRHIQLDMNASSNGGPDNAAPTRAGIANERKNRFS